MKIIKRVTQFPLRSQPEGDIAFNINTKQLRVYKDNAGNYTDYDSFYVSPDVDALGVNGYYPLYRTKALSDAASPLGTSHEHDGTLLGTAPDGVDYPLYMPDGLSTNHHGTYIDPVGDDDSDGIPNFRDPDILGLTALPSAGIKSGSGSIDGYTTPISTDSSGNQVGGINVAAGDITSQISNPGAGSYNDTGDTIIINATGPGVLIKATGSVIKFNLNDPVNIEPGDTFVYQGGMTGSGESSLGNEGGDSAGYTGSGNFQASGGQTVDVEDELSSLSGGAIDTGTTNNTGDNITKSFTGTGVLVGPDGTTTQATSPVVIPDGSTLFVKSGSGSDDAHWNGTTNPVILSGGNSINLTGYLTLDGNGDSVVNNSGDTSSFTFTGDGFLVSPEGAITGPLTSPASIPAGYRLFTGVTDPAHSGGGSSTGTDAGYTGGDYSTGSGNVNVESELGGTGNGTIDGGTSNGGSSNISKTFNDTEQTAILVDDATGVVTQVTTSPVTIPPGSTLFVKTVTGPLTTKYDVTFQTDGNSTASAFTDTNRDTGTIYFLHQGQDYELASTPNSGFEFDQWVITSGGGTLTNASDKDSARYVLGTSDATLTATYKVVPTTQYTATFQTDGNGSATPYSINVDAGSGFTLWSAGSRYLDISTSPNTGFEFDQWVITSGGGTLNNASDKDSATYTLGTSDAVVTATYKAVAQPITYNIIFRPDSNGLANAFSSNELAGSVINLGEVPSLYNNMATSTPSGFEFDKWTFTEAVDNSGGSLTNASDPDAAQFTTGSSQAVVTANFKAVSTGTGSGTSGGTGDITENLDWSNGTNDNDFQVPSGPLVQLGNIEFNPTVTSPTNYEINFSSSAFKENPDTDVGDWQYTFDLQGYELYYFNLTFNKAYIIDNTGDTIFTITVGGQTYEYDLATADASGFSGKTTIQPS